MATTTHTRHPTATRLAFVARWSALQQNDDGDAMPFAQYSDKSVQVTGTFGGATVRLEGSNDSGATWAVLTDPQGNDLLLTSAKIEMVTEVTELVRPRVVGGDGTTNLTVSLLCKEVA